MDQKKIEDILWNCYCPLLVKIHIYSSHYDIIKQEDLKPFKNKIICAPEETQSLFTKCYENPTNGTTVKLSENLKLGILSYKAELNKLTAFPINYSCGNCKCSENPTPFSTKYGQPPSEDERLHTYKAFVSRTVNESLDKNRNCNYFIRADWQCA